MSDQILDTIDLIYAAATDTARWSGILSHLSAITGCIAGGLTVEDPAQGAGRPLTFFGFDPNHVERCFDYYLPMNPLFAIESKMQPGFVVTNSMVVEEAQFCKSEFYNGWAKPQGICSPLSLVLHRQGSRYIPLTLVRPDGAGDASDDSMAFLKKLSPHLMRALDIGLEIERLSFADSALHACLDHLPVGVILLDAANRAVRSNAAAEDYLRSGAFTIRHGEVHARRINADQIIQSLLSRRQHDKLTVLKDIRIDRESADPLRVSIVPVPRGVYGIDDSRVVTMIIIRPLRSESSSDLASFAKKHTLTRRETEFLNLLAIEGLSLAESADRLEVQIPTAKTHLQHIFQKTDTKRQSELLAKVLRSLQ